MLYSIIGILCIAGACGLYLPKRKEKPFCAPALILMIVGVVCGGIGLFAPNADERRDKQSQTIMRELDAELLRRAIAASDGSPSIICSAFCRSRLEQAMKDINKTLPIQQDGQDGIGEATLEKALEGSTPIIFWGPVLISDQLHEERLAEDSPAPERLAPLIFVDLGLDSALATLINGGHAKAVIYAQSSDPEALAAISDRKAWVQQLQRESSSTAQPREESP